MRFVDQEDEWEQRVSWSTWISKRKVGTINIYHIALFTIFSILMGEEEITDPY